jgi:hypothetical protein
MKPPLSLSFKTATAEPATMPPIGTGEAGMIGGLWTVLAVTAAAPVAPALVGIDDLAWLGGQWESVSGEQWVEESWTSPRGGTMLGISRAGAGALLREFEFLRLQRGEDGVLAYIASPGGGAAVVFPLVEATPSSATFANPGHDFPQLIRYERDGETMRATISASDGGNAMSWTFRRLP